jgi:hypothetical protein
MRQTNNRSGSSFRRTRVLLWVCQGLLAALFLFAGGMKLAIPAEKLASPQFSGEFLHFIGLVEVLGAFGLILPGLFRIGPRLTPLAAAGLVIIMVGATYLAATTGPIVGAAVPFITGVLAAFIAYGRSRLAPHASRLARPAAAVAAPAQAVAA